MPALVESMFSGSRNVPWHGLGVIIDGQATARQAYELGGLDFLVDTWDLVAVPPFTNNENPEEYIRKIAKLRYADTAPFGRDYRATVRINKDGSMKPLAVVGADYHVIQNKMMFEFAEAITDSTDMAIFETAGVLDGGKKVWAIVRLASCDIKLGDDISNAYLLISNSFDQTLSFQASLTNVRVVCWNTFSMSLRSTRTYYKVKHTTNAMDRVEEAKEALGFAINLSKEFQELAESMATSPFSLVEMKDLSEYLFPQKTKDEETGNYTEFFTEPAQQNQAALQYCYLNEGSRSPATAKTAWAGYNAVTEFVDHKPRRGSKEKRLEQLWFGPAANMKDKALNRIVEMKGL